jgi:histidinol phosphatase-like enzyme
MRSIIAITIHKRKCRDSRSLAIAASPHRFFKEGSEGFHIALSSSWMVGDRAADIECGRTVGTLTIRVREDHPAKRGPDEPLADFEAADLAEAMKIILHPQYR